MSDATTPADPLTSQQLIFCREYAGGRNATQAYLRAYPGCTYHAARANASRLLANDAIRSEVRAARSEYLKRCEVDFLRTLRELVGIAHADPDDLFTEGPDGGPQLREWSEISPAARRTVRSVKVRRRRQRDSEGQEWEIEEVEVKLHSKDAALDKLCRHLGITRNGAGLERLLELVEEAEWSEKAAAATPTPPAADTAK